jgi:Lysylphosphatidylglycerol synthase TM region
MQFDIYRGSLSLFHRLVDPSRFKQPRVKRTILGLAVVFLMAGIAMSLERNPNVLSNLDWRPLALLMFVAVPVTLIINACTFLLTSRMVGRQFGMLKSIEICIISTAANLLPLPGGALVRIGALKAGGTSYGEGTKATLLVAGLWAGVAFLFAGVWMLRLGVGFVAVLFVAVGLAAWLSCFIYGVRQRRGTTLPILLSIAKVMLVTVDALRIFLCLYALGLAPLFDQAAALAVAGVVGNAVSIIPAGLGVREAVSAGLGPLVGLDAAIAFLAASLNRLLGLIIVVPLAIGLLASERRRTSSEDTAA